MSKTWADYDHTADLLKNLGAPARLQIIGLLADGKERSPKMMADLFGLPLGRLSYHVRFLKDGGLIEETRVEPARGALQHFYVITLDGLALWKLLRRPRKLPKPIRDMRREPEPEPEDDPLAELAA